MVCSHQLKDNGNSSSHFKLLLLNSACHALMIHICASLLEMILLSWNWLNPFTTMALCRSPIFPDLMKRCLMASPVSSLAGGSWTVSRNTSHSRILHQTSRPPHCSSQTTAPAPRPSCKWLPSRWWSIPSAPSLSGGAASPWRPWCVLEGMESYQAARYKKLKCACPNTHLLLHSVRIGPSLCVSGDSGWFWRPSELLHWRRLEGPWGRQLWSSRWMQPGV